MLKKFVYISFFILLGFIICAQEKKKDKLEYWFNAAISALADKDNRVRQAATETLGQLGDKRAVPHLIKALVDEYENVREAVANALGNLGDKQAVPHLIKALTNLRGYCATKAALDALCKLDEKWTQLPEAQSAVSHFINSLHDKDKAIRKVAAEALGELRDKRAVPHLIKLLNDVPSAAAAALYKIDEKWTQLPEAQSAVSHFINSLHDKDKVIRKVAAEALGKIGDKRAVPYLIKALNDDCVSCLAAVALGELRDKRAVPYLIRAMVQQDWMFFIGAWEALHKIDKNWSQSPDASALVPELIDYLRAKESCVRASAADILGVLGDKRVIPDLIRSLKDKDEWVRKAAAKAIERIKTRK